MLKGVAAVSDVASVASAAHAMEQALLGERPELVAPEREQLLARWATFRAFVQPILRSESAQRVNMSADDLAQRSARLFLVRTAPEQAHQPLAAFVLRLL